MTDLLHPGSHRLAGALDDDALVAALLRVEAAWVRALGDVGALEPADAEAIAAVAGGLHLDPTALDAATEDAGNVVVPLVRELRTAVTAGLGHDAAAAVHRGLTSQDVLDTALVLLARDGLARVRGDLHAATGALADLAERHRGDVMVGRTLTQWAVPITFGLKAAQWLAGVADAAERVDDALAALPVQCGGAAGTLALVAELTDQVPAGPVEAARAFAARLDLVGPGAPWHTRRGPVTSTGDALVAVCDALGTLATDVALLSRPEIAEVREGQVTGRGGSSTMPHKRNPVLSVLVRSAALQAPLLGAQLHLGAAQAVDERPDGAWHAEWPALRRLLEITVTAASQAAELVSSLEVDATAMRARAEAAAEDLLAERGRPGAPQDYLGATDALIDAVLARVPEGGPDHA